MKKKIIPRSVTAGGFMLAEEKNQSGYFICCNCLYTYKYCHGIFNGHKQLGSQFLYLVL